MKSLICVIVCVIEVSLQTVLGSFKPIDFSSSYNARMQDFSPVNAQYFPEGDVVLGEVPFSITSDTDNIWQSGALGEGIPNVLDIVTNEYGVDGVHTLINTHGGVTGGPYVWLEFFGTNGAYCKKGLYGDNDIRDYYENWYTNNINGTTTINVFKYGSGYQDEVRLDKQWIDLPASFDNEILTGIRLTDDITPSQQPFLAGVTVENKPIVVIAPNGGESWVAGNTYPITWQEGPVIYHNDFEDPCDSLTEWSNNKTDFTPSGRRFLGQFQNNKVSLTIDNLPVHTKITLNFDLYVIRSWDGLFEGEPNEPDIWNLSIQDGPTLLHTTFGNCWWADPVTQPYTLRQAYPGWYPGGDYPIRTGAAEVDTLGYIMAKDHPDDPDTEADSVYNISFTFAHSASSLQLNFSAEHLQDYNPLDESWGLDNVRVTAIDVNDVLIEYSTNNGQDWSDVNTAPNSGVYEWLVPEVTSNQCLIRISDSNNANIYDVSDDVFTIFECLKKFAGDIDKNCYVDFIDLALLAQEWLTCGNPFDPDCGVR